MLEIGILKIRVNPFYPCNPRSMSKDKLQLKYGLGIMNTIPFLPAALKSSWKEMLSESIVNSLTDESGEVIKNAEILEAWGDEHIHAETGLYEITVPSEKEITIYERAYNTKDSVQQISVFIEPGAKVTYIISSHTGSRAVKRMFTVENDAKLLVREDTVNTDYLLSHTHVSLSGEKATFEYNSAFYGSNSSNIDTAQFVSHDASHTRSRLTTRGVLTDNAKGYYQAEITIPEGSYGCSGHQDEKTILLSNNARMMAVPVLEISNNDVSCSHAVATTRIKPEDLFYLRSRGMPESAAKESMVRAHLAPVLGGCADEVLGQISQST